MLTLRDYQQKNVNDIRMAFSRSRRVLFVLPTGGGKTVVFSYITENAVRRGNVLLLAHRQEIVGQISKALNKFGVSHGLIMPGSAMNYELAQVGMVQSTARRLDRIHPPNLIVVDEAHHSVAGSWQRIIESYPEAKILGVTATPQRLDGRGLHQCFDEMVIGPSARELMDLGYLSRFDLYAPPTEVDFGDVTTARGDFNISEIEAIMDKASITGNAVDHYKKHLNGRPAIAFCVTVQHAENVRDQFRANGWRAESIDGKMKADERQRRVDALGSGELNVLTSCDIISEGFDVPVVAGAILLRPTQSLALYLQQIGRALRPKPDGGKAVILDHVGNVHRHGMPDEPREWSLEGKLKGPAKGPSQCEKCYAVFVGKRPPCEDPFCPVAESGGGEKETPEELAGELKAMQDPYAWAHGINIATARGEEWISLLHHADSKYERLKQIQILRGYKHQWVLHQMGNHTSAKWAKK